MKKTVLVSLLWMVTFGAVFAQNSAVTNAFMYHKDGEYLKAKEQIDKAIEHPKTSTKSKTWFFRGNIYRDLAPTEDGNVGMYKVAAESYSKAMELGDGDEYATNSKRANAALWGKSLNAAIKEHQAENLDDAMRLYEVAMSIKPADTLAYFNGTIAAEQAKNYTKVIEYNETLLSNGNTSSTTYIALSNAYKVQGDNDKAIETLDKGLASNPNNQVLMNEKINIQISTGKGEEAIETLEAVVEKAPENDVAWYNLAYLHGQVGNKEKSIEYYKKALEVNPDNEDANYMLGNTYFNEGAELYNEVQEMGFGDFQKSGAKKQLIAKSKMKQSIPYFEKVHELNPDDQDTMKSLMTAYEKVGRTADSEAMYKKMNGE